MTKLMQWLSIAMVFGAVWLSLICDLIPASLSAASKEVIWASPIYLLMVFACYSLAVIGYRVATFRDCTEAAEELKEQIGEARADLTKKGFRFT